MRKYFSLMTAALLGAALFTGVSARAQDQQQDDRPSTDDQQPQQQQAPRRGNGQNVGGNWLMFSSEDPMTAAKLVRFELDSNNTMPDSDRHSKIVIECKNGHYEHANFVPAIRMAGPNRPGFWGQPQMEVIVRVNDHHDEKGWNWEGRALSMDKGTVREAIGAHLLRIEFLGARRRQGPAPNIAEFSPEGLDLGQVHSACDLTPKKP